MKLIGGGPHPGPEQPAVKHHLEGQQAAKAVFVPDRIVNLVVR
jgi:hypothetical protein